MNSFVISQPAPKTGARGPVEPEARIVSTYSEMGDVGFPCTGTATISAIGVAVEFALSTASVGVNVAPNEIAPAAAGVHAHVARNGVTVLVMTAEHPVIDVVPAVKSTVPATLVVAVIVAAPMPIIAFGFVSLIVVAVCAAAEADATPMMATLPKVRDPATTSDMILFMVILLLLG